MYYIILGLMLFFYGQLIPAETVNNPPPINQDGSNPPPPSENVDDTETSPPPNNEESDKSTTKTLTTIDNTQLSLSATDADQCELTITNTETGQTYDGISGNVAETDFCDDKQTYSSSLRFDATEEGVYNKYFCFKTETNGYYGWGVHNCLDILDITEVAYSDNGDPINIPIHDAPIVDLSGDRTLEEILDKTVAYGDKYITSFKVDSSRDYQLRYELQHAPIDTKLDTYNQIITWEAMLLGRFRFNIIIHEVDAAFPQKLVLKASVNVIEHKLSDYDIDPAPENIKRLSAEDIENLPPKALQAFRKFNIEALNPEVFGSLTAKQMSYMTYSAISAISVQQFLNLQPESLGGISPRSFGGFAPEVLFEFTTSHINALNPDIMFRQLPGEDTSKIVTNFDLRKIIPKDINELLPPGWFFDPKKGGLTIPSGTPLTIKALDANPTPPPRVKTPKFSQLNSALSVGGEIENEEDSILSGMNLALKQNNLSQFKFNQDANGIVKADDASGLQFAFIPDNKSFAQQDDKVKSQVQVARRGLQIVTSGSQSLSLIPAPKDMDLLENTLSYGDVYMGLKGDVIFDYANIMDNRFVREDSETDTAVVCEFDSFVETLFDFFVETLSGDYCYSYSYNDYDIYTCDDEESYSSDTLGVQFTRRTGRLTRAGEYEPPKGRIVYADKTAQTIYPTIIAPSTFLTMLHQIDGLEKAEIYKNGAYLISFNNTPYILQPDFTATATPLPRKNQLVPPAIHFQEAGYLEYHIALEDDIEYIQKVFIYPYTK